MELMMFLLFASAYCSDVQQNMDINERRLAGGGNYGGFIGLTTYGAGPFLVRGKLERDNDGYGNRNDYQNNQYFETKFINNVGYEDIIKSYDNREFYNSESSGYTGNNDDLEYLGYTGRQGYCIGEYRNRYRYNSNESGRRPNMTSDNPFVYNDEEINNRCDILFGFNGPNGNDEPENLIRPCALDDRQCIRKYFAANSNCKPTYGPIPDPLYIDINTVYFPFANITMTLPNLEVRGLSSTRVTEFYVNRRSRNLVISFDVMNLNLTIPRGYLRYRRTGKESIVLGDYLTINYRLVTFTAVIPNIPKLRLDLADIHPDVQDGAPVFFVGPGVYNSTDPDVATGFATLISGLPVALREGLIYQAQLFTSIYIQNNICDFGLQIISV